MPFDHNGYAAEHLPGATLRRLLFWRYLLVHRAHRDHRAA